MEEQKAGKTMEAVRGFERVLKSHLGEETEISISGKDVITLVRWAAMVSSRFLVGKDGKTACERPWRRRCDIPVEKFCEKVCYKKFNGKMEDSNPVDGSTDIWYLERL